MNTSIRNQIKGTITSLRKDAIMAELIIETPAGPIVSVITAASVESLGLQPGDLVHASVKATNVSVCKCDCGSH